MKKFLSLLAIVFVLLFISCDADSNHQIEQLNEKTYSFSVDTLKLTSQDGKSISAPFVAVKQASGQYKLVTTELTDGALKYESLTNEGDVIVVTNNKDLIVNAPASNVDHYGKSKNVSIIAVAGNSYHCYADITQKLSVNTGHIEISEKANNLPLVEVEAKDSVMITIDESIVIPKVIVSVDSQVTAKPTVTFNGQGQTQRTEIVNAVDLKLADSVKVKDVAVNISEASELQNLSIKVNDSSEIAGLSSNEDVDLNDIKVENSENKPVSVHTHALVTSEIERDGKKFNTVHCLECDYYTETEKMQISTDCEHFACFKCYVKDNVAYYGKVCSLCGEHLTEGTVVSGSNPICAIKKTGYDSLINALAAAKDDDIIEILKADDYNFPNFSNKTIRGAVDKVCFDCTASGNTANLQNVKIENVKIKFGQSAYTGFQHSENNTFVKCVFEGLFFSYGNMTFDNCTFEQDKEEYCMWVYAGDVTYNDCTFTGKGKFLNVYNEGNDGGTPWKVTLNNCVFNSDTVNKSAVNVKATCNSTKLRYNVTINNCTTNENFPTNQRLGKQVVMIDDGDSEFVTITLDGDVIYKYTN